MNIEDIEDIEDIHLENNTNTIQRTLCIFGCKEIPPDENGLYNGLIVPKDQANYLYTISWVSFPAGIYAITQNYYDLALVPLGVCVTSLNYWRNPTFGWRRNIDMTYVIIGLLYQVYRSYTAENRNTYYIILTIGTLFYPISKAIEPHSTWLATIAHSMVHIIGNISNFILYNGYVEKWV